MPTLNKKCRTTPISNNNYQDKRRMVYTSKLWKTLRKSQLMCHPLCELCLLEGKVNPAIDVHHIVSFTPFDGAEMLQLAYDSNNLLSICKQHHQLIHNSKEFKESDLYKKLLILKL